MSIDYARMQKTIAKHRGALTRAKKQGYEAVLKACRAAVEEWNAIGAWPDGWHTWNVALGDASAQFARETGRWPLLTRLDQI